MRINHNMSAVITNKKLLRTESALTKSMERLSSGYKINHAKDNASGMAISNKMKLQIKGLSQASRNAADGQSIARTVDVALNDVTSILQRMRELAVQGASDTYGIDDKKAIQQEIESLKEEVNRIAENAEFNGKPLLDGTLSKKAYINHGERLSVSEEVLPGTYEVSVSKAAEKAEITADTKTFAEKDKVIGTSGTVTVNGVDVTIDATDTYNDALEKIRKEAAYTSTDVTLKDDQMVFSSKRFGTEAKLQVEVSNEALAKALGFNEAGLKESRGSDAEVTLGDSFTENATKKVEGNRVTIKDENGFEMQFVLEEDYVSTEENPLEVEVSNIDGMIFQVGAHQQQHLNFVIPKISAENLYIDDLNVVAKGEANRAMEVLDEALSSILNVRARAGAADNRLEYAVDSLDAAEENVTSSLSRILDTDMAEEMSEYTKQNVLQQAAVSVLTQANQLPEQVLQILN